MLTRRVNINEKNKMQSQCVENKIDIKKKDDEKEEEKNKGIKKRRRRRRRRMKMIMIAGNMVTEIGR